MSEVIRVIDLSEWTGPVFVENARRMVALWGVRGVILQAWGSGHVPGRRNEYFHQAVDAFRQAGVRNIDPYIWPPSEWRQALDWIGDYKRFMAGAVYLDVEAGAGVDNGIVGGVARAGWEPRIYASPASWAAIMGNTHRYNDLKLWLARYLIRFRRPDGYYVPGFDVAFPRDAFGFASPRVGGWRTEDLVGWQTTGTVPDFCGESVDCSVFHLSAFRREEKDMAEDQALRAIVADLKKVVEGQSEDISALQERLQDTGTDVDTLLTQAHEHEPDVPEAEWRGAMAAHTSNPDAHHE